MRAAPPAAVPADLLDGISEASPAFPLVGEPPDLRREGWTAAAVFTSASAALAAFEAVLQRMRDAGLCPRPIFFEEMCFQEWQRDEVGARANDPFGEDFEGRQRIGETPPPTGRVRGHGCEGGADAEGGLLLPTLRGADPQHPAPAILHLLQRSTVIDGHDGPTVVPASLDTAAAHPPERQTAYPVAIVDGDTGEGVLVPAYPRCVGLYIYAPVVKMSALQRSEGSDLLAAAC